jgi:hypothetical protein
MQKQTILISDSFLEKARNCLHQNKDAIYQVIGMKMLNCDTLRAFDLIESSKEPK